VITRLAGEAAPGPTGSATSGTPHATGKNANKTSGKRAARLLRVIAPPGFIVPTQRPIN
jgi:hypothetical protein